jgi:PAS domain S-box-containing protein
MNNFKPKKQIDHDLDLLSKFIDVLEEASCILNRNSGKIFKVNSAFLQMTGYQKQEVLGLEISDLPAFPDKTIWATILKKLDVDEKTVHRKIQLGIKNGHRCHVQMVVSSVVHGEYAYLLVRLFVVTESQGSAYPLLNGKEIHQKKTSGETAEKVIAFGRELAAQSSVAEFETDLKGSKFLNVNNTTLLFTGYSREEFLSLFPQTLVDAKDRDVIREIIRRKLAGEEFITGVMIRIRRKDGKGLWILLKAMHIKHGNSDRILYFTDVVLNGKHIGEHMSQSRELLSLVASSTPDHILVQDTDLRYTFIINPFPGLKEENLIGHTDYDILRKPDADLLTRIKRKVLRNRRSYRTEIPVALKDSEVRHYNAFLVPKYNSDGVLDGLIGYLRDVSELKKVSDSLRNYAERLEDMVLERTADVSHANEKLVAEIDERSKTEKILQEQTEELKNYQFRLQELVKERSAELQSNTMKLAREIVERRRIESALADSEQMFHDIAHHLPGMIFQLRFASDGTNHFSFVSPSGQEIFDLPADMTSIEESLLNCIHPDDRGSFLSSVAKSVAEKSEWKYRGRIMMSPGTIKWFEGYSSPVIIGEVTILNGILLDITSRVETEKELQYTENCYRDIFNMMSEGVALHEIICDKNGKPKDYRFLDVNKAFETLTGLSRDAVIGRKLTEILPPEDQRRIKNYEAGTLTGKPVHSEIYSKLLDRYFKIQSFSPTPGHFAIVFKDITDRKKVTQSR